MLIDQLLELAREQIGWQLDAYNSLEVKAVGLVAFDGALATVAAAFTDGREPYRTLFFAFVTLSAAFCLLSLWVRKVDVGPRVGKFYVDTSGLSDVEAHEQLLADLSSATLANHWPLARKGLYWTLGAAALLVGLLFGGLSF